jgi:hypothetical protein
MKKRFLGVTFLASFYFHSFRGFWYQVFTIKRQRLIQEERFEDKLSTCDKIKFQLELALKLSHGMS